MTDMTGIVISKF